MSVKINSISKNIAKEYLTTPEVVAYIRSCYKNLLLNRRLMIDRQLEKLENQKKNLSYLPSALQKRRLLAKKYPKDAQRHLSCAETIENTLNRNIADGKRSDINNFLQRISDDDFNKIVSE